MRKFALLFLVALLLSVAAVAAAEEYTFSEGLFSIELNPKDYDVVLTPYNLPAHREWIEEQGMDYDIEVRRFESESILLRAHDSKNGRIFVVTAVKNLDAEMYFDLNEQDDSMRKEFRQSHTNGSAYGILGYTYSSAAWQKYSNDVQRFLHSAYSLHQNGQLYCTGYQRRTIRNGYTITLDMQVYGHKANKNDEKELQTIMKSLRFTSILPMPELPIKLNFTSAPPQETSDDTFTIKGTSEKKAVVTATVMSFGSSNALTFRDTASNNGSFSMKVQLPSQGVYTITVTAEKEGCITAQRMFSVTYQKGMLSVNLTTIPGEFLTDETVITGSTEKYATTQVSMTGPIDYTKSSSSQNFSFKLDTSAEGNYLIIVKVTKKGMNEKVYTFNCTRTYTDVERTNRLKNDSKEFSYKDLSKSANKGKLCRQTGYVVELNETNGEWLMLFALGVKGDAYKDLCYVILEEEPSVAIGQQYTLYGIASETYSIMTEEGSIKMYPRIEGYYLE
ncbi:MAG: hypothetical protein IJ968_03925 [Clostridia bacterium]|nr:hypothetical protein [Clostridia bacterium]